MIHDEIGNSKVYGKLEKNKKQMEILEMKNTTCEIKIIHSRRLKADWTLQK